MPAARDFDWSHIHVLGDRDAAAPYVGIARKMLGYVKQDAQYNHLGVHSLTRRLDDGTVITAEIHGTIPRITIKTRPRGLPPQSYWWADYACATYSDTGKASDPVLLRYGTSGDQFFYWSSKSAGYAHPASTYAGAYPAKLKDAGGLHFLCGEHWHENDDGECVSWYGVGKHRYWYSPYRAPVNQGWYLVFHQGDVLLNLDAYGRKFENRADMAKYFIRAAALRKGWLYCVLTQMDRNFTYEPPTVPARACDIFLTPAYETCDSMVYLVRFPLRISPNPVTGRPQYTVGGKLHTLWSGSLHNGDGPWVFSKDLSVVTTVARPDECRSVYIPGEYPTPPYYRLHVAPSANSTIYRLRLSFTKLGADVLLEQAPSGDVIAEDSGVQASIVDMTPDTDGTTGLMYDLVMRGRHYPLLRYREDGDEQKMFMAQIQHLDVANDVVVIASQRVQHVDHPAALIADETYDEHVTSTTTLYRAGTPTVLAGKETVTTYPGEDGHVIDNYVKYTQPVLQQTACGVSRLFQTYGIYKTFPHTAPEPDKTVLMYSLQSQLMASEHEDDFGGILGAGWLESRDPGYGTWTEAATVSRFAAAAVASEYVRPATDAEVFKPGFPTVFGGGGTLSDADRTLYADASIPRGFLALLPRQAAVYGSDADLKADSGGDLFREGMSDTDYHLPYTNFVKLGIPPKYASSQPN